MMIAALYWCYMSNNSNYSNVQVFTTGNSGNYSSSSINMNDIGVTGNCLIVAYNFSAGDSKCTGAYPTCNNGTILGTYAYTNGSVSDYKGSGVAGMHKAIVVAGNKHTTISNLKDYSTYESGTVIIMY